MSYVLADTVTLKAKEQDKAWHILCFFLGASAGVPAHQLWTPTPGTHRMIKAIEVSTELPPNGEKGLVAATLPGRLFCSLAGTTGGKHP